MLIEVKPDTANAGVTDTELIAGARFVAAGVLGVLGVVGVVVLSLDLPHPAAAKTTRAYDTARK
jgi:hypothetical protein